MWIEAWCWFIFTICTSAVVAAVYTSASTLVLFVVGGVVAVWPLLRLLLTAGGTAINHAARAHRQRLRFSRHVERKTHAPE